MAEKFKRKFKNGDKVVITNNTLGWNGIVQTKGVCGVIYSYRYDGLYDVTLEKEIAGLTMPKTNIATLHSSKLSSAYVYSVELL